MNERNYYYPSEVLLELNAMRDRAELTDVVLEVEGRSFPCHRAILASCSPYFRGMFTSGYVEAKQERVSIKDVSGVAMATILDYAYTGCLQTEPDQVQAVMSAARLLQVDFVGREAAGYMEDHLDVSNCADVLMYADMLGDSALVQASEDYVASSFHQVALQPSFLQLPLPLLQSLLNREDLMTSSSDNIVQTALRWIEFDKEERLQHLPELCRCLRRSFISSDQLVELESKCPPSDDKLVYSNSTTQRLGQVQTTMQIFLREGSSKHHSQQVALCYDPSTGELHALNMPNNLASFSVTATPDDKLYLAGGLSSITSQPIRQKAFYQYNHLPNTWEPRCDMGSPRVRCGLVYLKGYIYAIGGDDIKQTAERYDPSCDEWTPIPAIPQSISSELCAVTLDDCIYVISKEGCYCFSTTENKWNKMADMHKPQTCPQAVTYRGIIYSVDCNKDKGWTWVEMYKPTNCVWERSGLRTFNKVNLMKHKETMYLLSVIKNNDIWSQYGESAFKICIYQYQPETDFWVGLEDKGRLVPPIADWMGSRRGRVIACLSARMVPMFLGDEFDYEEFLTDDEDTSGSGNSVGGGSDNHLSDQEDSDEDTSGGGWESRSDDYDI
ncbi:kelch repeat and BTB domain-containing protein 8-like isoform X1 [Branchiostoma floridae x Branchiostoma japonicum]